MQSATEERQIRNIKRLIWLYIFLLIFEGALRKWIVPQLSNPLLIIRDPVVLAIYYLAARARVFPWNRYLSALTAIAVFSCIAGFLALLPYLPPMPLVFVTAFGFRSNFLHLPLIFIMGRVLDERDVKKIGWWILAGMVPMALLMAAQFKASPDSFINRTAGLGTGEQITAGGGKIRPPATFSFVSGVISYVACAAAFLLYGAVSRSTYKNWLLFAAGFAVVGATAVSGSRSVVAAVLIVVASLVPIIIIRPDAINQFGRNLLIVVVVGVVMSRLPIFKEGIGILSERFVTSAEQTETSIAGGLLDRMLGGFTEGFRVLDRLPMGGYGLGIGTNGGAKFVTGRAMFLLAEGEWARILLESGPILGIAFLLWRTLLTIKLGYLSIRHLATGEILPIILYSAGFLGLLDGQFGQPTSLGFAVLVSGLCLASMNRADGSLFEAPAAASTAGPLPRIARRSAYAARLHEPSAAPIDPNGPADR